MKHDQPPPEKLLEQLVANSAALCEADLRLKAVDQKLKEALVAAQMKRGGTQQHGDKTTESYQSRASSTRRFRLLLLLLACLLSSGLITETLFPGWLSQQWSAFLSLTTQPYSSL